MAKRSNGKTPQATLSRELDSNQGPAESSRPADGWTTLRKASDETGVSISTLRNWYRKGLIDSRVEKGPNGSQRIVRLEEVVARTKTGRTPSHQQPDSQGPADLSVAPSLSDLMAEHAAACERAGRAEARNEFLERELEELRARLERSTSNRPLQAENQMLRERLELLRSQAEDMARRLSLIEGEPEEIDLDDKRRIPPPEEDEFLALTQRWKARRKRRRAARRDARRATKATKAKARDPKPPGARSSSPETSKSSST